MCAQRAADLDRDRNRPSRRAAPLAGQICQSRKHQNENRFPAGLSQRNKVSYILITLLFLIHLLIKNQLYLSTTGGQLPNFT